VSSVFFFFFCLSAAAAWSALPSVMCGSFMRSSISVDWLCSLPAVLLRRWLLAVLFYWGLVSLPHPLSCGKFSDWSASPLCQCVVMVCCLLFNFAGPFVFGCCSLAQKMNIVVHYLLRFRQWLIFCLLSAFLPFQPFVYK
jgi:hypothetical protein